MARVCIEVNEKGAVENFILEEFNHCDDLAPEIIEKLEEWEFEESTMKKFPRHAWISKVMEQLEKLGIEKVSFFMDQDENSPFMKKLPKEMTQFYPEESLDQVPVPFDSINKKVPYPLNLQKKGLEGTVMLEVFVNRKGEVDRLVVLKSSGHSELDELALSYVELWTFRPGKLHGSIINSKMKLSVDFFKSAKKKDEGE